MNEIRSLILVSAAFLAMSSQASTSSTGTRGGGHVTASEFSDIAREVFNALATFPKPLKIGEVVLDASRFLRELNQARVFVTEERLVLNGKPVNAINTPSLHQIVFSAPAWLKMSAAEKRKLVAHEFWALVYTEFSDQGYIYSNAITKLIHPEESVTHETFKCMGAEPFWNLTLASSGGKFTYDEQTSHLPKTVLGGIGVTECEHALSVKATDGTLELLGFIAKIPGEPGCNVGMGNLYFPYQIQFFFNGKAYTGCCETQRHPVTEGEY